MSRKMSWAKQQRMRFVTERLHRTGFINRKHLADKFAISIPQASADLATFMQLNPGAISYNKTTKRFERVVKEGTMSEVCCRPHPRIDNYTSGYVERYCSYAKGHAGECGAWSSVAVAAPPTIVLPLPAGAVGVRVWRNETPLCSIAEQLPDGKARHCGFAAGHDGEHGAWFELSTHTTEVVDKPQKRYAHYLGVGNWFNLNQACRTVSEGMFTINGCYGLYLVGSSLHRPDYRDVDIRMILEDAAFDRLFGAPPKNDDLRYNSFWTVVCMSISEWLHARTGLPIDFQIQRQTEANATYDGPRNAVGMQFFTADQE